eukprot:CAMPEP_0205915402 /NCGR_PEP_ID=MMETSP1325-20131115/7844_1 /ASSEMBLY_ACC=CAM_ASM_000708 /TAXON_ID=236786 /ORGANISM="Florenciella sp., Strain RCC1007" /LENGTH=173 /DNA_ID=CAMNT_0053282573 /DNA_START=211 /DNA_END=728 /DNA_ORIENTATION=-
MTEGCAELVNTAALTQPRRGRVAVRHSMHVDLMASRGATLHLSESDVRLAVEELSVVEVPLPPHKLCVDVQAFAVHLVLAPAPLIRRAVRPRVLALPIKLAAHERPHIRCARGEVEAPLALHGVIHPFPRVCLWSVDEGAVPMARLPAIYLDELTVVFAPVDKDKGAGVDQRA